MLHKNIIFDQGSVVVFYMVANRYTTPYLRFTWYFTQLLKIGFGVTGVVFYSYYIHQGNKSDKETKLLEKKTISFMHTKRFITFLK